MKTPLKPIVGLLLILIIACSRYGNELQFVEYGSLNVLITDAPFPFDLVEEANITVRMIDARRQAGSEDQEATFEVLYEGNETINLLELTNGVTKSLGEVEVPVGTYDLVRVYVTQASIRLVNGKEYELKVPSGEQTGIKVFIRPNIQVVNQLSTDLLLDVDVSKSFVLKGNIENADNVTGFNFKPVIRAKNMSTTGTLTGTVTELLEDIASPLEGAEVSVMVADTVYTATFTDSSGEYLIMGLDPGAYSVKANKEGYLEGIAVEVEVFEANTTTQGFQLSAN